jgi:hypothetical protein
LQVFADVVRIDYTSRNHRDQWSACSRVPFLEQAGFIKGRHLVTVDGVQGVRYVRFEIVALVERAWATAGTDECDAMTLFSCAKTKGIKQGEVMTMVIKGELVPCRLDLEATEFRRLMFRYPGNGTYEFCTSPKLAGEKLPPWSFMKLPEPSKRKPIFPLLSSLEASSSE